MSKKEQRSSSVIFLCGEANNGNISLCESFLFYKCIHAVSGDNDNLIALGEDGCYYLESGLKIPHCDMKATNFIGGLKSHYILTEKSQIYSWGVGLNGELGLGICNTDVQNPTFIKYDASFTSISSGDYHCTAIDSRGNAYSWGQNLERQLGLHKFSHSNDEKFLIENFKFAPCLLPFSIQYPISKICCGTSFTIAIGKNGSLWSWGSGDCGQLGTGLCKMREVPIVVKICPNDKKSDVKIVDVACGNNHVIAAGDDHSVYSWGLNTSGQLGLNDGKNINKQYVPTLIPSISFAQVYAKGHSSAGINAAGDLYTWGSGFKQRLMQNKEIEDENGNTPSPHRYSPTYVEDLFGNIVHSFAFSKTGSAALVMTRLYGLNPKSGPQKSFNELKILGCGFWDSDKIVVKFTKVVDDPDSYGGSVPKSRSAPGKLVGPGLISCRPPRLSETGDFLVEVSMDGVIFVQDSVPLTIYSDVVVTGLTPRLFDLRDQSQTFITLSVKGLPPRPTIPSQSVPRQYNVKLVVSPFSSHKNEKVVEVIVTGKLQDPPIGEVVSTDLDETISQKTSNVLTESMIICDIKEILEKLPKTISTIRAQISMNDVDYSVPSSDTNQMIICHAFQPLSLSPTSCQCPADDNHGAMREVCVTGSNFFPSKDLPSNLTVQAILSATITIPQAKDINTDSQASSNKDDNVGKSIDKKITEAVSMAVSVKCLSQESLSFVPPSLNQFLSQLKSIDGNKVNEDNQINVISSKISFQMITKSESDGKDIKAKPRRTSIGSKINSSIDSSQTLQTDHLLPSQVNNTYIQPLSAPTTNQKGLFLELYNPQAVIVYPGICRRKGSFVTVTGASADGFRCCPNPEMVKVLLTIPGIKSDVILCSPDVKVITVRKGDVGDGESSHADTEIDVSQGENNTRNSGKETKMTRIQEGDVNDLGREISSLQILDSENIQELSIIEYKIQFNLPDISSLFVEGNPDIESLELPDNVDVRVMLDGESYVPSQLAYNVLLFEKLEIGSIANPKGGFGVNAQVTVGVTGVHPSITACILRIRGDPPGGRPTSSNPKVAVVPLKQFIDISGLISLETPREVMFTIPDDIVGVNPVLIKKAKMFFIEISLDGGFSFDSSTNAILNVK